MSLDVFYLDEQAYKAALEFYAKISNYDGERMAPVTQDEGGIARAALEAGRRRGGLADDDDLAEYCWRAMNGMPRDRHTVFMVLNAVDAYLRGAR